MTDTKTMTRERLIELLFCFRNDAHIQNQDASYIRILTTFDAQAAEIESLRADKSRLAGILAARESGERERDDLRAQRDAIVRHHHNAAEHAERAERQRDRAVEALQHARARFDGALRQHYERQVLEPVKDHAEHAQREVLAKELSQDIAIIDAALDEIGSTPERERPGDTRLNGATATQCESEGGPRREASGDHSRTEAARRDDVHGQPIPGKADEGRAAPSANPTDGSRSQAATSDGEKFGKPGQDRPSVHQASEGARTIPPLLVDQRNMPLPIGHYAQRDDLREAVGELADLVVAWVTDREPDSVTIDRMAALRERVRAGRV